MAAIWMWVRSEQRSRVASLVGLVLAVGLGVGAALTLAAGAHRADTVFGRFAVRTGAATIVMSELDGASTPTSVAESDRHLEVLDRVRAIDGVEALQVLNWFGALPDVLRQPPDDQGRVIAFSQGYSYFDPAHPPFLIVAGSLPAPDDPEGVVINEAAADQFGFDIGSPIEFNTASAAQFEEWGSSDGRVRSYAGPRVHAVVRAIGRSLGEIIDPSTPDVAVMPGLAAAMNDRQVLHCACFVGVRVKADQLDEVRSQLEQIYRPYGLVVRPGDSASGATEAIGVEVTTLRIAAAVAAIASVLVVAQFVVRSASSMAARDDARRALGMVRKQRAAGVALVLAPSVVVGTLLGVAIAYLLSGLFPRGLALSVEPERGLRLDPTVLGVGGMGFVIALGLLVAVVAWRTARGANPPSPRSARPLSRLLVGNPCRALGTSFALDPSGRRPAPVAALTTLIGLAMASGGIVAVTTIQESRDDARSDHRIFGAPAEYLFDDNGASGAPAAIEFAQGQAGVAAITRSVSIDDATSSATGAAGSVSQVEPRSFDTLRGGALPTLREGSTPRGDDEVALGNATARELGVGIGDTVTIANVDGATRTFRVVGLVVSWGSEDAGHAFIVNSDARSDLLCDGGVETECNLRVSVWADAADAAGADALLGAGFVRVGPPDNLDRLQQVGNIPWYLAGVLCVLGLAGLAHTLTTSLRRRRMDLAIGRALGWTPRQSATVLIWQAMQTALVGGVVGVALGQVVGRVLWGRIASGLDIVNRPDSVLGVAALTIVGLVAASGLLALPAALWARRLPTAQILQVA